MPQSARDFVTTKPLLVFVPYTVADDRRSIAAWRSRLAPEGTRLRIEGDGLHCKLAGRWMDVRLTAALSDADLPPDRETLEALAAAGVLTRSTVVGGRVSSEFPELIAAENLSNLLRVDSSEEFSLLMEASEDLRYAAEDLGFLVLAHDVGSDRSVGLSVFSTGLDLLLSIECDTALGEWTLLLHEGLAWNAALLPREFDAEGLAVLRVDETALPDLCSIIARDIEYRHSPDQPSPEMAM